MLRIVPTRERFYSYDFTATHVHLRLIMQINLSSPKRASKASEHIQSCVGHSAHVWKKGCVSVAAATFGGVHCEVRGADQSICIGAITGEYTDADARAYKKLMPSNLHRLGNGGQGGLRKRSIDALRFRRRKYDEFVATVPSDRIGWVNASL